ncbi:MAG: SRPBCC domain-containing protein [Planctomycetes bacterium]|nr:SRPBCC domain-containing protein [Planctomycetota bacterium]
MHARKSPPPEFARDFVFTRTIDAPRELVFAAWTEPRALARWWGPAGFTNPRCELDPRRGGAIHIDMTAPNGDVHPMAGVVRELVAPERFVFTAGSLDPAGEPLFEVRNAIAFTESGGRTTVTVTSTFLWITDGIESSLGDMDDGWKTSLQRLADAVAAMKVAQGGGASSSTPGAGNEATSNLEIQISRVFSAPRELLWEVWTRPEHVARWWGPNGFTTKIEELDVRPGGRFKHTMHGPDGANYPGLSVFREVVPHERIVYSHGGGRDTGPGVNFTATWTFEALADGRTKVVGRMVFLTPEDRDLVVREFGAIEGGHQHLARLAEHVAAFASAADELVIERTFAAPRERVFRAWTELEELKRWWGPKGFEWVGGSLDLRPGGRFHYGLRAPNGAAMWGKFDYRAVVRPERLVYVVAFSDEHGGTTRHPMAPNWPLCVLNALSFAEHGAGTKLTMRAWPLDASDDERAMFRGAHENVRGGFKGTLDELERYLAGK